MNEYKKVRLGDVCEFVRNGASIKQNPLCKNGIPITRIETISNDKFNFDRLGYADITDEKYSDYYLRDSDVLLSHINSAKYLGRSVMYKKVNDTPIIHGMNLLCLRFIQERYYPAFFVYYSQSNPAKAYIGNNTKLAVNQASITASAIKEMPIPLPPIETQKQIAATLDKVTKIITENKKLLEKYDLLIKSRFIEMFGDPVTNPMGWDEKPLSSYCIVNPKKNELGNVSDDYEVSFVPMPLVSEKGDIDSSNIKRFGEVKKGFTYFYENDVLFAKITPCMENGKGCVAKNLKNKIGFGSTEFHVLRPIDGISTSEWLYRVTTFKAFRKDAENNMTGSAGQRRTPKEFFDKYKIGLPPLELQQQFAAFVHQIDKSKFEYDSEEVAA